MSRLTLLGTGCPSPSSLRYGPSTLFTHEGKNYLFDCGSGVTQRLSAAGIKSSEVEILFITHLHSDHVMDLYQLYISGWHQGRETKFKVVGPYGTKEFFENIVATFSKELKGRIQWEKRPNKEGLDFEVTEINETYKFQDTDLVVTPFEVDHYPVEPAYGYQITFFKEEEEKSIIISGDTRKSENLIKYAHNADALVHEVFVNLKFDEKRMSRDTLKNVKDYHTSPKELGEIANIAQVKKLILTHFVPPIFDESELIKNISEFYKGEIIIGEDLMFIKF
ncbi:MBL fold metallo-hydrolase [Candidatus Actinomarina]|nr:MBL fold metallo-hydrolase [Candidatus Actinomarina sp.]